MISILVVLFIVSSISRSSIDGFCPPIRQYYSSTYRPVRKVLHVESRHIKQQIDVKEKEHQPTTTATTTNKWIVVVEDEDFLRNAIGKYVSKEGGYHVTGVADARSAYMLCRGIVKPTNNRYTSFKIDPNHNTTDSSSSSSKRPDCIVLDVRLGGELNGIELLNIIRADAMLESLPVILLTAKGKVDDRIAGYEAGADAYLTKPFDPEELLSVLEGVLRRGVVSSGSDAAIVKRETLSSTTSKDSMVPMEEIKREILEIKSLLRQRNNNNTPDGTFSNTTAWLDESDTTPSFASMYNDLLEMKEEIKATSLQPEDDDDAPTTAPPKVTLDDINELYFTPDEQKVISLVEKGLTNKEIGEGYMNCSTSKVEKIVSSLFKKTGTKKRPQLVKWCKQNHDSQLEPGEVVVGYDEDNIPESSTKLKSAEAKHKIMDLIGNGFTNKEIVANTGVSLNDIVTVVDAMLDKAKVKNRTELMRWWNSKVNKTSHEY